MVGLSSPYPIQDPSVKRNRIVNESLCESVRLKQCEACGKPPISECHHIITKARLGPDLSWNLMALCHQHHMEWHDQPLSRFFQRFPHIIPKLVDRGFFWDDTFKKLIVDRSKHPESEWIK